MNFGIHRVYVYVHVYIRTYIHTYIHMPISSQQDHMLHFAIKVSYMIQFKVTMNIASSVHINDAVGRIKHLFMVMVTKAYTLATQLKP